MIPPRPSVLGRRRLSVLGEDRRRFVTVTLMSPEREERAIWQCELRISGAGLRVNRRIRGADALQALQLALHAASIALDASGLRLSWGKPDGQWAYKPDDWTGFDRPVPRFLGPGGAERNERVRRFLQHEQQSHDRAVLEAIIEHYERMGFDVPPDIRASLESLNEDDRKGDAS